MGMIFINNTGLDFRQDTEPLIKSFYPDLSSETDATIAIDAGTDKLTVSFLGSDGAAVYTESEAVPPEHCVFEGPEVKVKESHRLYRNSILRMVYRVISHVSGRTLPWGILTGVRPTKLVYDRISQALAGHVGYMEDTYYCSNEKAKLATLVAAKEYQLLKDVDLENGYSLYIGIPFCPSICNYCTFGSHPMDRFSTLVEPYIEALKKEIEFSSKLFPLRKLETVYFGGGTPTAVSAQQLRDVIRCARSYFDMENIREFTVEAGRPDSITEEKLLMLKDEGVSRISVNPQSMVERTLQTIGRKHTPLQTVESFRLARRLGFDNINMDLIAGLSGEDIDDFRYTLSEIEKLDPDSLTVHTLAHKRAARLTTDAEAYAGLEAKNVPIMVDEASRYAKSHGYEPYYMYRQKNMTDNLENVGYAKLGKEGLYNVLIMEEKQMILALGAGGSSKFVRDCETRFERVENVKNVGEYISRIDEMCARKSDYIKLHDIH